MKYSLNIDLCVFKCKYYSNGILLSFTFLNLLFMTENKRWNEVLISGWALSFSVVYELN